MKSDEAAFQMGHLAKNCSANGGCSDSLNITIFKVS